MYHLYLCVNIIFFSNFRRQGFRFLLKEHQILMSYLKAGEITPFRWLTSFLNMRHSYKHSQLTSTWVGSWIICFMHVQKKIIENWYFSLSHGQVSGCYCPNHSSIFSSTYIHITKETMSAYHLNCTIY